MQSKISRNPFAAGRTNDGTASPGPGYYYSSAPPVNHKQVLSTSKKGSSSFASKTERFPLRHAHWGMPGPSHYNPGAERISYSSIRSDPRHPSASFIAVGRDHPFGNQAIEETPAPGQYNTQEYGAVAKRLQSYNITYANTCRPESNVPSEYKKLQNAARRQNKSVSKYVIENDPLYNPLPAPLQENALTAEERFNPENRNKELEKRASNFISPHVQYRTYLQEIAQHFNVNLPSSRDFIQNEINADLAESPSYAYAQNKRSSVSAGSTTSPAGTLKLKGATDPGSATRVVRGFKGKTLTGRIAGSSTTYIKKPVTIAGSMGMTYLLDRPNEQTQIGANITKEQQKKLEAYEKLIEDAPSSMKENVGIPPPGQYRPAFGLATANQDTILREHRIVCNHEKIREEEKTLNGPGAYTVQDSFTRRRTESIPALHSASERFKAANSIETPGPGTYDISRDLNNHKSFLLNEENKFVIM